MSDELEPHFVRIEMLNDKSGELGFDAILKHQDWRLITTQVFAGGYTQDTQWLKLTLNAPPNESLLLSVIMTVLDDVRLYAPDVLVDLHTHVAPKSSEIEGWKVWQQGDLFPFNQRELDWRGFSFALRVPDTKLHTVYLRVASTSSHLIYPQLWKIAQFENHQKNEMLLFGFVIGVMLVFLLLAMIVCLFIREKLQKYYLALLTFSILYLVSVNGFLGQWGLNNHPQFSSNLVGVIIGLLQIPVFGFHREFLFGKIRHTLIYKLQSVIMLLGLVTAGFAAMGQYHLIASFFGITMFISISAVLVILCWIRWKKFLDNNVFLIYIVLLPINLISMSNVLGFITVAPWLSIYGVQIGSLINLAILLVMTINDTYKITLAHQQATSLAKLEAQASQLQRYWLAMLIHEIKTPLSIINASCQSLELLQIESSIQSRVDKIKRSTARINNLIHHFLRNDEVIARLHHLQRTPLNLQQWLSEQLQLFDETAQKRWRLNILLELTINADESLLAIALNNLLTNALKYSHADSPIEITVQPCKRQRESGVLFSVKDYGEPISEQRKREELFHRYQLTEYAGNGVGLWACREIARAHHGEVWLDDLSRMDGNTFNIWLPIEHTQEF